MPLGAELLSSIQEKITTAKQHVKQHVSADILKSELAEIREEMNKVEDTSSEQFLQLQDAFNEVQASIGDTINNLAARVEDTYEDMTTPTVETKELTQLKAMVEEDRVNFYAVANELDDATKERDVAHVVEKIGEEVDLAELGVELTGTSGSLGIRLEQSKEYNDTNIRELAAGAPPQRALAQALMLGVGHHLVGSVIDAQWTGTNREQE